MGKYQWLLAAGLVAATGAVQASNIGAGVVAGTLGIGAQVSYIQRQLFWPVSDN